jgi:hypothetical protein
VYRKSGRTCHKQKKIRRNKHWSARCVARAAAAAADLGLGGYLQSCAQTGCRLSPPPSPSLALPGLDAGPLLYVCTVKLGLLYLLYKEEQIPSSLAHRHFVNRVWGYGWDCWPFGDVVGDLGGRSGRGLEGLDFLRRHGRWFIALGCASPQPFGLFPEEDMSDGGAAWGT